MVIRTNNEFANQHPAEGARELAPQSLNIRRGLFAAALCGIVGALIPAALALAYFAYCWWNPSFVPSNRWYDFLNYWPFPIFGCAAFLGSAAWATFGPPGKWRFAPSLAMIFLVSVSFWFLIISMDATLGLYWLQVYRGDPPTPHLSQALILFVPPVAMAQILAISRLRRIKLIEAAAERHAAVK